MAKQNKPAIRFKEFTDAWEQRKLGDCFTERCESMPDGELISVTINDGIKKFSELGRHDNSNDDKSKYKKVCAGDIAYNSMRMWQGASGCSPYEGIVSPAYTVLTPNSGINSKCMAYQFKLPATIHTFKINSQGITSDNWNLKFPALSEIEIYVSPYEQEQAKIAAYFANLDHLITLHQRKYDKLQVLKKAMLEKMFPKNGSSVPEIRFKGFTDAWEQRKLGDMMNVTSVKRIHQSDWTDSGVRFLRARDIVAAAKNEEPDDYLYISKEKYEEYSALSGKVGVSDLLVTGVGTIGVPYLVRNLEPLYFKDGNIIWFQNSDKIDGKFLFYSFSAEQIQGFINESAGIGTVGTYTIESGKKTPISLPNQIEQAKVGEFFQQLDNLITLHQRELEKLQNIKKSMLEKMFV